MKEKEKREKTTKVTHKRADEEGRTPEFETPSQRRNRDGVGRGPNGSDGGANKGRGSNH